MKRAVLYLLFSAVLSNAVECFDGRTTVSIPDRSLPLVGYTVRNVTRSTFDCKHAYKRYKASHIQLAEPYTQPAHVNTRQKDGYPPYLFVLAITGIIVGVWIIVRVIRHNENDADFQVQSNKCRNTDDSPKYYRQVHPVKSLAELSNEYSENLNKLEQEREQNGFHEPVEHNHCMSPARQNTAYEMLLNTYEWKQCRQKVLSTKGRVCEWCGSHRRLQVHHKYYLKYPDGSHVRPWEYNIDAFLVLCRNCHEKAHQKYTIKSYFVNSDYTA